jgi:hypothetical protein
MVPLVPFFGVLNIKFLYTYQFCFFCFFQIIIFNIKNTKKKAPEAPLKSRLNWEVMSVTLQKSVGACWCSFGA